MESVTSCNDATHHAESAFAGSSEATKQKPYLDARDAENISKTRGYEKSLQRTIVNVERNKRAVFQSSSPSAPSRQLRALINTMPQEERESFHKSLQNATRDTRILLNHVIDKIISTEPFDDSENIDM